MGKGLGYGKVILFGEHFVVYGIPSIVSAINSATEAIVTPYDGTGFVLEDNRNATPQYKEDKLDQQCESIERILKASNIDVSTNGLRITLGGDLYAASGVGASAASCAAIARALSDEFSLNFSDERINELAFEGEKGYHGTPSGVDNTAATYGGLLKFTKRDDGSSIELLTIKAPIRIVMGNTGKVTDTKRAVAGVRERRDANPEQYAAFFDEARAIARDGQQALEEYALDRVGALMNANHALLQNIEVSCDELDNLVAIARDNGAAGAKLTGGGLGGYMIALTPDAATQGAVANAIESAGFQALRTTIG